MRLFLLIVVFGCSLAAPFAWADEDTVPIDQPVATFMRPQGWPAYPDDHGVLTVSSDGRASVDMLLVNAADDSAAVSFALDHIATTRLKLQPASRHLKPDRTIDGRPAHVIERTGRDPEGPKQIILTQVKLDQPRSYLMIIVQGAPAGLKANAGKIERMLNSIKLLK